MALRFRTKRSAGIWVEDRVYRLIKRGDAARDARNWPDAARLYHEAISIDPRLAHIHVQRGHVLKEAGNLDAADAAYGAALQVRPDFDDAWISRALLADQIGNRPAALAHVARPLQRNPGHRQAADALVRLLDAGHPFPLRILLDELETALPPVGRKEQVVADRPTADASPLVFDLTDLISHFRHNRLPNGIQRVQIEVLLALLTSRPDHEILACCFTSGRDGWIGVPLGLCRELLILSGQGSRMDDPAWQVARARLFLHLAMAPAYLLPIGATLVNLGISFWVHDYFRFIRNAKQTRRIRYVPLVYDMIPVLRPSLCAIGWRKDFTIWLVGVFQHADAFLAISRSAKQDLLRLAAELGHEVEEGRVEVVPLDADFRRPHSAGLGTGLDTAEIDSAPFALMVATIEPRKNHVLALDAWAELLRRYGADKVPRLICVGRDGWMNDEVFDLLDSDPALAAHVTLAYQLSDASLAHLYSRCLFTVFPSLYEGWGLPVTEALCHGRLPVVADNSALREAGGRFALFFADNCLNSLIVALEKASFDHDWRTAREAEIAEHFHARDWAHIAIQIGSAARRLAIETVPTSVAPSVECGRYYPVNLYVGPEIGRGLVSGEIYRVGDGWAWPTTDGCRTLPPGGDLRLSLVAPDETSPRLYLHVRGLTTKNCTVGIFADGKEVCRATLRQNKARWLACDFAPRSGVELLLSVRGDRSEVADVGPKGRPCHASVEVLGFFFLDKRDSAAVTDFMHARRTALDTLNVYRKIGLNADGG